MPKKTRNLKDFSAQYDRKMQVRKRLTDALVALRKLGREEWRSERELIDSVSVSCKDIGELRPEFEAHIVIVPSAARGKVIKRIWFADPRVAAKARPQ